MDALSGFAVDAGDWLAVDLNCGSVFLEGPNKPRVELTTSGDDGTERRARINELPLEHLQALVDVVAASHGLRCAGYETTGVRVIFRFVSPEVTL